MKKHLRREKMEMKTVSKCEKGTVAEGEKVSQMQFTVEVCGVSDRPYSALPSFYSLWGSQIQSPLLCLP